MGKWWERRVDVCDVLRSLVFILKAVSEAGKRHQIYISKNLLCESYVEDEGVKPHSELNYSNPRRNERRQSQRG